MRTKQTLAALAIALGACDGALVGEPPLNAIPASEVQEALDLAAEREMEWGVAPWSPPGWPLRVGDKVSQETMKALDKAFLKDGGWLNGEATNWVDDLPFGALFYLAGADSPTPWTYHGHFPRQVDRMFRVVMWNYRAAASSGSKLGPFVQEAGRLRNRVGPPRRGPA